MDFSEAYKASVDKPAPCYSPDGRYLATSVEYRLIIREVETLRIVQLYSCVDRIDTLSWSASSLYVLCGLHARSVVQIWSVDQPEWTCKIDEGPAGIARVLWTPDGLGVVVVAQFGIRITVWSLMDRKCTYLRGPKHTDKGLAFTPDGATLAVLERYDFKDHLSLYSIQGWKEISHVQCDTSDAADLAWAPDGAYVAVWDSPLSSRVSIHDSRGAPVALCTTDSSSSQLGGGGGGGLGLLGLRGAAWNPSGHLLALGGCDQVVRVVNHVTWQPLLECHHPTHLDQPPHCVVYREVDDSPGGNTTSPLRLTPGKSPRSQQGGSSSSSLQSRYVVDPLPATIPSSSNAKTQDAAAAAGYQQNKKVGIGSPRWSPDSQFLVTLCDTQPCVVWVWDMAAMELCAVLVQQAPVQDVAWAPQGCTLAIVTGAGRVFMWTPAGASIVHIPLKAFTARGITWGPPPTAALQHQPSATGASFVLTGADQFCCAYVAPPAQ